jgi:hypothetical protein
MLVELRLENASSATTTRRTVEMSSSDDLFIAPIVGVDLTLSGYYSLTGLEKYLTVSQSQTSQLHTQRTDAKEIRRTNELLLGFVDVKASRTLTTFA